MVQRRLLLFCCIVASIPSRAEEPIDFDRTIRPIFEAHCLGCHGSEDRKGGLLLTSRREALLPTDSGEPALVPGDPDASELWFRVESHDELDRMPPSGNRLAPAQIEAIRAWIAQGADWPGDDEPASNHWAYLPPVRPDLPDIGDQEWCRNPIDRFIRARLNKVGIEPSPEADRATLIRRLSLDITGLPPTPEEVDAFLQDERPDAYDRIVDRLLASPRYGERWATPWLDLARFADSNGFQRDGFRDVWPYRDWVVQALNADMPFDQFTVEQLAGDLFPDASIDQRIATGFNRGNPVNVEAGVDQEENRVNGVVDRVNAMATVWLGSTIACAQCHNHKYDPITQREYYQLFAYFNNTPIETIFRTEGNTSELDFTGPAMEIPSSAEVVARREELANRRGPLVEHLNTLTDQVWNGRFEWEEQLRLDPERLARLPAPIQKVLAIADEDRSKAQQQTLKNHLVADHPELATARQRLAELDEQLEALAPARSLVMIELDEPRPTFLMKRGNFLDPGPQVQPGVPEILHPLPAEAPRNRLGLAQWLVDPANPLIGRVAVNRAWLAFFGRGLVTTPEDFGTQGARPSHPDLLDWLAVEFVESGWSTKHLHRLIVTSRTYRQSSAVSSELLERDPDNALFARGARFRLDAETIRDNALFAAGLLSETMGGPPVFPPQPENIWRVTGLVDNTYRTSTGPDRHRRGLYTIWRRSAPYPSFVAFDSSDRSQCLVQRSRTNTPLQALTLLNDPAYVEIARALARRLLTEHPEDSFDDRLIHAFRLCLVRSPTSSEIESLTNVWNTLHDRYSDDPRAAKALLSDPTDPTIDPAAWAAWLGVANVLLNLDETITRE
ncbi:PSD1 and planctomycete cytochrome C domain-containing protein [Tautonia marina]|uniref:PSD1 and planctomycete cytochrome C domain-containing protein n=1 Tax=Tautonia marina TaxID=2653855 RepID=UPI001260405D|nr:PSD1 and planctomycete cytochrome C domain-containing protein [Tautonia marina]